MTDEEKKLAAEQMLPIGVPSTPALSPEDMLGAQTATPDMQTGDPVMSMRGTSDKDIARFTGPFGTVLNVVNRPFSAVMGVVNAADEYNSTRPNPLNPMPSAEAMSKQITPWGAAGNALVNAKDALWNGKPFGTKEMIDRRDIPGFDVPAPLRTLAAIAGDIGTGIFLDPIGKVKLLGELDDGRRALMSVEGASILPKGVDNLFGAAASKAKDALDIIPGYRRAADFIGGLYKTQRQTENKYGDYFNWLKGTAYDLDKGLMQKEEALRALHGMYSDKSLPKNLFDFTYAVLENPKIIDDGATIRRVVGLKADDAVHNFTKDLITNRVAEIDTALDDLNKNMFFKAQPGATPAAQVDELVNKFVRATTEDVQNSVAKQAEIEFKLRNRLWDTAKKKSEGVQGLDKDLQYLQRHVDGIDAMRPVPGDEPVQYVQNALRLRLLDERTSLADVFKGGNRAKIGNTATTLLDRAGANNFFDTEEVLAVDIFGKDVMQSKESKELVATLLPWQKYARQLYDEAHAIAGADMPKLPIENYMKHMAVGKPVSIFPKSWTKKQRFDDVVADQRAFFMASGMESQVADDMAQVYTKKLFQRDGSKASNLSGAERRGVFDPMRHRKYDLDGIEINNSDYIDFKVNTNAVDVTNRMVQDAERFKFATGVYKQALDTAGIDEATLKGLNEAKQKEFVPVDFRLKFLPANSVDPFAGKFLPKDMLEAINENLGVFNGMTNSKGTGALMNLLEAVRRSYSATTLIMFPGKYTRDFTGSYMNGALGGTHATTKTGSMAYGTGIHLFGGGFNDHGVAKLIDTEAVTNDTLAHINQLFPDAQMDVEKLRKLLHVSDLVGTHNFRDIGFAKAAQASIGQAPQGIAETFKKFGRDFAHDINPMNPGDMERMGAVRGLNPVNYFMPSRFSTNPAYTFMLEKVSKPVEDVPRAAVYLDHLMRNGEKGMAFEQANSRAVTAARKYIGDPTAKNLTNAERNIIPLAVPFYKWSRHNLPLQVQTLAQEPGKYGSLARAYRNQYDAYEGEVNPQNTADFIKDGIGAPTRVSQDKDGNKIVSFGLMAGWIPAADIGQIANMLNPQDGSGVAHGASEYLLSQANGWMRGAVEDAMDYDTRLREKISDGHTQEMFGFPVSPRAAHLARQIRFLNEVDRLNPGNIFTHLGHFFGNFSEDRPNRNEVEQYQRWLRLGTGISSFDNNESDTIRSDFFRAKEKLDNTKKNLRNSAKEQFGAGLEQSQDVLQDMAKEFKAINERWNELQKRRALDKKAQSLK